MSEMKQKEQVERKWRQSQEWSKSLEATEL